MDFSDSEARIMLRLLSKYVNEFGDCANMKLSELAADLCMSMDETTDDDDRCYRSIIAIVGEE